MYGCYIFLFTMLKLKRTEKPHFRSSPKKWLCACSDCIMKLFSILMTFVVIYGNSCCKATEHEGYRHDDISNLTTENNRRDVTWFMKAQNFTAGTLLGLLVAFIVVVIGSFLVLWRLCCEVEVVVTREVIQPLNSISQKVASKPSTNRTVSSEKLLGHSCSSSVLEIA